MSAAILGRRFLATSVFSLAFLFMTDMSVGASHPESSSLPAVIELSLLVHGFELLMR